MKKFYFAYGMNMDTEDMQQICPESEFVGLGVLAGHRLLYKGGGHADIVPAAEHSVPVAVFRISARDEEHLDYREGYPEYYVKEQLSITMTHDEALAPCESKAITGMVYKMADGFGLCLPSRGYESILRAAYRKFGWNEALLDEARAASQTR